MQAVNDYVFDGAARILYFDVNKEYRKNIKAKYSDLTRLVENIISSRQKSKLCFHYVDDMIFSGGNFLRTKNLLNTLIPIADGEGDCTRSLFESIILLVGRNSGDSRKWFVEDRDSFYEYVHLSISPMRNHEDACTLCNMVDSFQRIEKYCATNELAEIMKTFIKNHKVKEIERYTDDDNIGDKRARVIVRHLLAERLANKWRLNDESKVVNSESVDDIYEIINLFYEKLSSTLEMIIQGHDIEDVNSYSVLNLRSALIKVISRPFFCYHIRQKQAALRFCLELLNKIISKINIHGDSDINIDMQQAPLIMNLINALADLNSNYLVRAEVMSKLLYLARKRPDLIDVKDYYKAIKKLVVLAADNNKSVLLEHILVKGSESAFFNREDVGGTLRDLTQNEWVEIYLENNNVLIDGFKDIVNNKLYNQKNNKIPYYLESFNRILNINAGDNAKKYTNKFLERYANLYSSLEYKEIGSTELKSIADNIEILFKGIKIKTFLIDHNEQFIYDKYYLIGNKEDQLFYLQDNLAKLEKLFQENPILNTVYYLDNQFIVKFCEKDEEKAIYLTYSLNDKQSTQKWFILKILLTLRYKFIKLISNYNVVNEINKLSIERIKRAMEIKKAHAHYSLEYFEGRTNTFKRRNEIVTKLNQDESIREQLKELQDKYLLFLANEFVTEVYYEVIYYPKSVFLNSIRLQKTLKKWISEVGFFEEADVWKYNIRVPSKNKDYINVCIICKLDTFINKKFWFIGRGEELISYFIYLILTFAANAGLHYVGDKGECTLEVFAVENDIVFKNNLSNKKINRKELVSIREKTEHKMKTPPWEFEPENQSITLWSFFRFFQIMKKEYEANSKSKMFRNFPENAKVGDGMVFNLYNNYYEIKLQLLEDVERSDINEGNKENNNI